MNKSVEVTATEFSNRRGEFLDEARAGKDIIIRRNNRIAAVMISKDRYEKLENLEKIFNDSILKPKNKEQDKLLQEEFDIFIKKIIAVLT